MKKRNGFFSQNKVLRRIAGAVFVIAAILLTQVPTPNVLASASADFRMNGDKLVKYAGTANTVSVPASVKTIGAEAFADCAFLTGVTIANGVEKIEYGAFSGCKSLRRITIPASVTQIGREAFSNCIQLNKVVLGKGVETIEPGAFLSCTALKTIEVSRDNPYFVSEKGALYNKTKTKLYTMCAGNEAKKLTMPKTVEHIESYAFWNCVNLQSISFSGNLKEIPAYAFSSCNGLEQVAIPYSVKTIDMKAFENCENLAIAEIPPSVNYIHLTAFDGCDKLKIMAEEGSVAKTFQENKEADAQKDAQSVSGNETTGTETANPEEEVKPQESVKDKKQTNASEEVTGKSTEPSDAKELGKTIIVSSSAVVLMDSKQTVYGGSVQKESNNALELVQNVTSNITQNMTQNKNQKIEEGMFYRNTQLTNYTIEEQIKQIGDFAFARSALTAISIPEGVTSIGYASFYHCDRLEQIDIPKTVTDIKAQAFQKTKWMDHWMSQEAEEFLVVGDGILIAYRGNQSEVTIPEGVKKIAGESFAGHAEITKVQIPASTTEIGDHAFANCVKLTSLEGGKNLTNLSASAFAECPIQPPTVTKDK